MTSKLKCPFCQTELIGGSQASYCNQCAIYGYNEIWQALIQAKQDLETARQALKWLGNNRLAENPVRVEQLRRCARNTLEQIEHKD